jgi:hypothetical protein
LNIERGVVTFSDDRLAITPPPIVAENERVSAAGKRPASLTEEEFYTILASECAEAPPVVKSLVQKLENLGLAPEFKRSLIMRWTGADGRLHNIINIRKTGRIKFEALSWQLQTEAELAVADTYRQSIADAVGGEVRGFRSNSSNGRNVWIGDNLITVDDLRQHEDSLVDAVERLLHQFHELEQNRERLL